MDEYNWAQMKNCSCSIEFARACARICEYASVHLRVALIFAGAINLTNKLGFEK